MSGFSADRILVKLPVDWQRWYRFRRSLLWGLLVTLIVTLLLSLVWLVGRYEQSRFETQLEQTAIDLAGDVRSNLGRDAQRLQVLTQRETPSWDWTARQLLEQHPEILRIELRDSHLLTEQAANTPFYKKVTPQGVFEKLGRSNFSAEVTQACALASRSQERAYSISYFVPLVDGTGYEVTDMCMPRMEGGKLTGYLVTTYSLDGMLKEWVEPAHKRQHEISLTEADGTRLAVIGTTNRNGNKLSAQTLLDLPGLTLVIRIERWIGAPYWLANIPTALVMALALVLGGVLWILFRDMRRRLRIEANLAQELALRKAMEDSLITGLRARGLDDRITYVNSAFCEIVGFSAEELLGSRMPAPYWPPELSHEYYERRAVRINGDSPTREGFESVYQHKDGTQFPVLIFETPLLNASGVQTGWMSAVVDISAQRKAEELSRTSLERLQVSARLATLGEMASMLSHELNQPLAAISSYASGGMNLLSETPPAAQDWNDIKLALARIEAQSVRAGQVIKSVHDFVRRRDTDRTNVTPQSLFDSVMPLLNLQAKQLQVRLALRVEPNLPAVWCDKTLVEQVIINLARNGMQAMDTPAIQHRVLTIMAKRTGPEAVEFTVHDVGPGLPPEIGDKLFTPFFTTKVEGTGLGLSLCRTVIEQHGGSLAFHTQTQAPYTGTTFSFKLKTHGATTHANGNINPA